MIAPFPTEPASRRWRTPRSLFAALDAEFHFGLDACADESNRLVPMFIGRDEDALTTDWREYTTRAAWLNPPYGSPSATFPGTGAFIDRAIEMAAHMVVVALVESRTDTAWWRRAFAAADEVRLLGRVRFLRPDGSVGEAPKCGHTLFVFRGRPHALGPRVVLSPLAGRP